MKPISTGTKVALIVFFAAWFVMTCIEWIGIGVFQGRYVYWRGWEKTINAFGKEMGRYPFKPWSEYEGVFVGDLLNTAYLNPSPDEVRYGSVTIDEYGHRNERGFLDGGIDAVVIGSSFVTGAAFDQSELVSTLLTSEHGIRTYNFYGSIQSFWDSQLFWNDPPDYMIILASEGEVLSSPWRTSIVPNEATLWQARRWESYEAWQQQNDNPRGWGYARFSQTLQNYSLLRHGVIRLQTWLVNAGRSRAQIMHSASTYTQEYDPATDTLLYYPSFDDPRLGSKDKTYDDIQQAIDNLNQAQELLSEKGVTLIVIAVPSKTHLTLQKYRYLSREETALAVFDDKAATEAAFINIDMYTPMLDRARDTHELFYYKDDSHWKPVVNDLVSQKIADVISGKSD